MRLARFLCCLPLAVGAACAGRFSLSDPGHHAPPPPPPPPLSGDHPTVALVSAVGGDAVARIEWRRPTGAADAPEIAIYLGTDRATLFDGVPTPLPLDPPAAQFALPAGSQRWFAGLGVRADPGQSFQPSGCVLEFHTGAPIYVDPAADPGGGDGMSPQTAFGDLALGALIASALGGGSVWVAEGSYQDYNVPLYTGVYLCGGFTPDFALDQRSELLHPTIVHGALNQNVVDVHHGNFGPAVLDGITLVGDGSTSDGVADLGHWLELRSVAIENCKRGVKILATAQTPVLIAGCSVAHSVLEGVLADGPLDLVADSTVFEANGNEGLALQNLRAPEFGSASLAARGCVFHANGQEGLDCHLDVVAGSGTGGGSFDVSVVDCDFAENRFSGVRVDIAYDAFPACTSRVVLRGVRSRANGLAGIHLDLDSSGDALVQRAFSSANRGDGILVTSSTFGRMATVSDSVLLGNLGWGIRCNAGGCGIAASHCVFGGNASGGFTSAAGASSLASSIFWLQPDALLGVQEFGVDHALSSPCVRLPLGFARMLSGSAGVWTLASGAGTSLGHAEVDDDGVARAVSFLSATACTLDPAPNPALPASIALFGGPEVDEDLRLVPGSSAEGAGLASPGSPAVDAGPFAEAHGGVPGREDLVPQPLFRLAGTVPAWTATLAPGAPLTLQFAGGEPDPASLSAGLWVIGNGGTPLVVSVNVAGASVVLQPPSGGWQTGMRIELFGELRSTAGASLLGSPVIPLHVP